MDDGILTQLLRCADGPASWVPCSHGPEGRVSMPSPERACSPRLAPLRTWHPTTRLKDALGGPMEE